MNSKLPGKWPWKMNVLAKVLIDKVKSDFESKEMNIVTNYMNIESSI